MKFIKDIIFILFVILFIQARNVNAFDFGGLGDLGSSLGLTEKEDNKTSDNNSGGIGGLLGLAKDAFTSTSGGEMGPVEEYFIGRKIAARVIDQYPPVENKEELVKYVNNVGATIALGSTAPYLYHPYIFIVGESDVINAFAAPGGIIVITTAMLKFLKNEDELAVILGHEIAHVELQHGVKSVGSEKVIKLLNGLGNFAVGQASGGTGGLQKAAIEKLAAYVMDTMLDKMRNGYGVELESEADTRGMALAHEAGYYAPAMVDLIERFKEVTGSYGGASYPEKRAHLADTHVKTLEGSGENEDRVALREKRFNKNISF
jgi:beta-barrel assembly-enhancing protease